MPNGERGSGEVELAGNRGARSGGGRDVGLVETAGGLPPEKPISLTRLIFACMVAGGVQYGWALQLSLLTPYVQTLGISHALSSLMWLCGPIAGFLVQPLVGLWSDRCHSGYGRRRPFILTGCLLICGAVVVIGFSSDIGVALGDTKEHCSVYHGARWHAAIVFVVGFWVLDFSNNAVQGPSRALMADLSGHHGCSAANAIFCSWMAFGNILGYSSGSTNDWHKWFPFLLSKACCEACANLKGAFLVAVFILLACLSVTMIVAREVPLSQVNAKLQSNGDLVKNEDEQGAGILAAFKSFKNLPPGMPSVLLVTALTWLSWFPFILYDTDWMGREVYHGKPTGSQAEIAAYDQGVRQGAFGLLLNSIVLGISSFMIEPLCRKLSARIVWVMSNFIVAVGMAATAIISAWSLHDYHGSVQDVVTADGSVRAVALVLFAALGFPLAILYSVPFAVTAQLAQNGGGGQGLCTGVLNISIVVPQVIVALGAGPWDALFGKGNIPAFALASAVAFVCGVVGLFLLPKLSKSNFKTSGVGGMH
ncbi:sucrose transport protein SUT1-like [Phoenix dactylifera]|uniref:Sucrose transport protein SUT3 n=1 Tax=Phoenix dactylifera TaxID=42345 RepID=A0A8B8J7D6_PHODC|nr:sucrose transport protein SUT1-like [Phoenix dactylifera]